MFFSGFLFLFDCLVFFLLYLVVFSSFVVHGTVLNMEAEHSNKLVCEFLKRPYRTLTQFANADLVDLARFEQVKMEKEFELEHERMRVEVALES